MGGGRDSAVDATGQAQAAVTADIVVERGRVSVVTFNRPHKRNAISLAMWRGLAAVFAELNVDRSVRAVIVTGKECFSAGADISEFGRVRANVAQAAVYESAVNDALFAIHECNKPVIAAIQGFCIGGGMALAQACDFRIADRSATFGVPAAKLGIIYSTAECRSLVSIVGPVAAKRFLFGGERIDAAEAVRIGFADAAGEGGAMAATRALAEIFADNAPLSIAGMKFIVNRLSEGRADDNEAAIAAKINQALDSRDYREAVAAFGERRKVKFQGL